MKEKGIIGKKVKIALHNCDKLNTSMYLMAKKLFGNDWINQEPDFILKVLNSDDMHLMYAIPSEFVNIISKEELRRVFKLYKKVHFNVSINPRTYYDHIRMYTELKMYGENDLKWMSDGDNDVDNVFFRNEHLNWTDKIQFYKKGNYKRIYPEYLYDIVKEPIMDCYPVILDTTSNYNEESSVQSNCVKTYVGSAQSLIISLRKDSIHSNERATIEYEIYRENDIIKCRRIQSLGRFNYKLELDWSGPLFKLDELLNKYINDKRFNTVKLIKEMSNGTIINSDSEWNENGKLMWGNKHINSVNNTVINWM